MSISPHDPLCPFLLPLFFGSCAIFFSFNLGSFYSGMNELNVISFSSCFLNWDLCFVMSLYSSSSLAFSFAFNVWCFLDFLGSMRRILYISILICSLSVSCFLIYGFGFGVSFGFLLFETGNCFLSIFRMLNCCLPWSHNKEWLETKNASCIWQIHSHYAFLFRISMIIWYYKLAND